MTASEYVPDDRDLLALAVIFRCAEEAGWGISNGASFEAFPGLEDAAADYIEAALDGLPLGRWDG